MRSFRIPKLLPGCSHAEIRSFKILYLISKFVHNNALTACNYRMLIPTQIVVPKVEDEEQENEHNYVTFPDIEKLLKHSMIEKHFPNPLRIV